MNNFKKHLINQNDSVRNALKKLDDIESNGILFLVNEELTLIGSLTDGDIRRGFLSGKNMNSKLIDFIQKNPKYIIADKIDINEIIMLRTKKFKIIPVLNKNKKIIDVLNFNKIHSYIPVDVIFMAGGEGRRLLPLTLETPKPLLKVGSKPILEHNIDMLSRYGIKNYTLTVRYLSEMIEKYFLDGSNKNISIKYIKEKVGLGTISSVKNGSYEHQDLIVMNSDLLTNLNFEKLFVFYKKHKADFLVACAPYDVNLPYGIMETKKNKIIKIKEKPTYTYYSNAGIYIFKKKYLDMIPKNEFYNATDLIEKLISMKKNVMAYPITEYWLDIGKKEDYRKAQNDIQHINNLIS